MKKQTILHKIRDIFWLRTQQYFQPSFFDIPPSLSLKHTHTEWWQTASERREKPLRIKAGHPGDEYASVSVCLRHKGGWGLPCWKISARNPSLSFSVFFLVVLYIVLHSPTNYPTAFCLVFIHLFYSIWWRLFALRGVSVFNRKGFLYCWQMRLYLWSSAETLSLPLTPALSPEAAAGSWWLSSIRERGIRWPLKTQLCVSPSADGNLCVRF